jgi:anti-sigma factor (TIGR02949 family)
MSPEITASTRREKALPSVCRRDSMSETNEMRCEEALKHLLEFLDGELSDSTQESVERHLRTCRGCCSRMEFESRLKQRLSALPTDDVPSTTRDRVRNLIKRF